ncbi:cation:proton antiporter [Corynebacterium sp. 320]|uniref:Cation:proton antiporter n=1 Tax=Corynebacterium zhongnanshanii TaxID=2768834 RepID=A0ABQ6VDU0_9CORY|nr:MULTISPECIES: monovalent cation/H+ antiporter complex subunit F [Corynebacterium]KAB1502865.1 cation:proton antiporter [Corynebacterium sp. 320]KAB1552376.1 cation:proton antiporter [Corynebacterium sp. 321]KAB1554409.1 cation:proton antiporter [Corynebacterium sp. 319]KAB3522622.1 cation:proton antiporter [Corynebacterium zhongnanshanii]KAB3526528.1 cation:proton antiporter [Corynebacterium sp. 250]
MSPTMLLDILVGIAAVIVVIALLTVLWRAVSTHNDARRAVLSDMIFFSMIGLFLCYSMYNRTAITYDVALFAGLFGAISTIANARIISRGRR